MSANNADAQDTPCTTAPGSASVKFVTTRSCPIWWKIGFRRMGLNRHGAKRPHGNHADRDADRGLYGLAKSGRAEPRERTHNSSHQPLTECPRIVPSSADHPMHFTPFRQENCDSETAGPTALDCLRFCPAGTPFAQRNGGLCFVREAQRTVLRSRSESDCASPGTAFSQTGCLPHDSLAPRSG